ncbi:hypothetical protein M7793_21750, partial [Enterobacter hormaechei subsp. hoffmannii]|nr:hypothetical protein [Enterobacter hormaechei subsp. hoffmannii]
MTEFISRLFIISVLSFPALSFAITIPGNIHPERYTFFLTDRGGEMLREMNDAAVSVKLNNKVGFSAEAQSKAAVANISPLLYASGSSLVVVAEGMIMVYLIARGHRHGR